MAFPDSLGGKSDSFPGPMALVTGAGLSLLRRFLNLPDPGDNELHYANRQRMYDAGNQEEGDVTVEVLKNVACQGRDDHASHCPSRPAQAHDGSHILLWEHIRGQRKKIGRPPLMRRGG